MSSEQKSTKLNSFTDLVAWQEGHKLVLLVYKELKVLPNSERYNLVDQLQRAVVSITSNIAEGFARLSNKEKVQFLFIAYGSIKEVQNQLLICRDLGYLNTEQFGLLANQSSRVSKLILGLIKAFQKTS